MIEEFWRLQRLRAGTPRQRSAAEELAPIFAVLESASPRLAGTVPLDIDIEESDLDVLCCTQDLDGFTQRAHREFGTHDGFEAWRGEVADEDTLICRFKGERWPVEIFAQRRGVEEQVAFRHMCVEWHLLGLGGVALRDCVRELKRSGLKTEPAFAVALDLRGDPYEELLSLEAANEDELRRLISDKGFAPHSVGTR